MSEPRTCAACGGALETVYPTVDDPQSGDAYAVLGCQLCGLGHTDPIPDDIAAAYGDVYYGEQRHGITGRMRAWLRTRYVERHASTGKSLIDAGCGTGEFLRGMSERGWKIAGTELDHRARQLASTALEVRRTLDEFHDRAPVDVVTMWHSLEHVEDPKAQVEAASRLLPPGGHLIAAVPDFHGLEGAVFGRYSFALDVPRHLYHFDERSLTGLLDRAGFDVESVSHQEFEYDVMSWWQSALNACLSHPNVLFNWMIGRPLHRRPSELWTSIVLGALLLPPAVLAAGLSVLVGRGTIIRVVAVKRSVGQAPVDPHHP